MPTSVVAAVPYPPVLGKANWDKQKGIVVRILKSDNGVSAACEKAEKAYKAVNWPAFSLTSVLKAADSYDCTLKIRMVRTIYKEQLMPLSLAMMELSKVAASAAAVYKSKTLVPKSSREHAEGLAAKAKEFAQLVVSRGEALLKELERAEAFITNVGGMNTDQVLANPNLRDAFLTYCIKQDSKENFMFIKEYGSSAPQGAKAVKMFAKYIVKGQKYSINGPSITPFLEAQGPDPVGGAKRHEKRFDRCPWETFLSAAKSNLSDQLRTFKMENILAFYR